MIASPARLWTVPVTCRVKGMPFQGSRCRWASHVHVQHAKILQQEDTWPVEVDPNFGRGAYGLEDVPLTGKFPNKRDERTINIHISSPASKRRWIVTVSSSWYKPRDAWHLLWVRPNVIQTTWPIRVDWSRDIGHFYTKDAAIIRLDELG